MWRFHTGYIYYTLLENCRLFQSGSNTTTEHWEFSCIWMKLRPCNVCNCARPKHMHKSHACMKHAHNRANLCSPQNYVMFMVGFEYCILQAHFNQPGPKPKGHIWRPKTFTDGETRGIKSVCLVILLTMGSRESPGHEKSSVRSWKRIRYQWMKLQQIDPSMKRTSC